MWKLKIIIIGILVMVFCTGLHGQTTSEFADDRFNDGLLWMLEKGLPKYYSGVSVKEIKDLLEKETKYVMFSALPYSDKKYYLLKFALWPIGKSKFTNELVLIDYWFTCYLRDIQDDNVIEYWVIKRSIAKYDIKHGEPVFDKCLFKITVADTIYSSRRVVVESDSFIDSVEVCGRTIRFPKDNLYFLAHLEAWNWPKSYTNTDLADYIVKIDKNGEPHLRKLNFFEEIWRGSGGWLYP
jgi:hypothetical protein